MRTIPLGRVPGAPAVPGLAGALRQCLNGSSRMMIGMGAPNSQNRGGAVLPHDDETAWMTRVSSTPYRAAPAGQVPCSQPDAIVIPTTQNSPLGAASSARLGHDRVRMRAGIKASGVSMGGAGQRTFGLVPPGQAILQ
jgi:hypothetical protein